MTVKVCRVSTNISIAGQPNVLHLQRNSCDMTANTSIDFMLNVGSLPRRTLPGSYKIAAIVKSHFEWSSSISRMLSIILVMQRLHSPTYSSAARFKHNHHCHPSDRPHVVKCCPTVVE